MIRKTLEPRRHRAQTHPSPTRCLPSLNTKRVIAHVLRHTAAMRLLVVIRRVSLHAHRRGGRSSRWRRPYTRRRYEPAAWARSLLAVSLSPSSPCSARAGMLCDHLHNLGIILGRHCRTHQSTEQFPTKFRLHAVGAERALKRPLRAPPPLAWTICAVLLPPRDDDADSRRYADNQRDPCLCGHAAHYCKSDHSILSPPPNRPATRAQPSWTQKL
jgi:hypothetical protein